MKAISFTPQFAPRRPRPILMGAVAASIVFSAAFIGNLATLPNIPTWYATLAKPPFNPPNSVFGPVWTVLYVLMAYSFWRVLTLPAGTRTKSRAVKLFVFQMLLNAAWSAAFFGLHLPLAGLGVIIALIVTLGVTVRRFYKLDHTAGLLLIPYLAWVSFAAVLNLSIWWLNR